MPSASRWTATDIPDLTGRTAVVTGANIGLGFETARLLAAHGATTVLACRTVTTADAAAERIRATSTAPVSTIELDLASLASVRTAAERIRTQHPRLDLLINNAGVGMSPERGTADGFEIHLGTNHLGHFALTGLLLDRLLATPGSRVVTVSSLGHKRGRMHWDDLQLSAPHSLPTAYFQSKLANLLFTYELQRRLANSGPIAVAAHPGNAHTAFTRHLRPWQRAIASPRLHLLNGWLLQSAEIGALAAVRAAVDPALRGGEYVGPPGRLGFTGYPEVVASSARSHDTADQQRLWDVSTELTGVRYEFDAHRLPLPG
ncbi:oxidoreductase [Cryptosporangium aurantiacum]|uniref:NAD(P)-dependent dehydrogenase, short-chain alcohol dehydrogenase family n=1 Tax=Cryptosporangium aurantiacum TaxID=134849 RepID=A0A1M7JD90_9ACTN|nr:oxidoreductase [Cryptosporangium aurantiacum]SHM50962.1 NAD(P)-dependent dehydrogenase, short-chain alcohol dehydrogenase family [Cryptosporangium aurantiacum]